MQFQLISSDDLFKLNVMVQDKLNNGWMLYGSPSVAIGASPTSSKVAHKIYAQAVIKNAVATPVPAATSDELPSEEEGNKATFVYESPDDSPDHFKQVVTEEPEPEPEPAAASEVKTDASSKKPTAEDSMEASIVNMARKVSSIKIEEPAEPPKVEVTVDTNLPKKEEEEAEVPAEKVAVEVTA